jgi:hypothetical protein
MLIVYLTTLYLLEHVEEHLENGILWMGDGCDFFEDTFLAT